MTGSLTYLVLCYFSSFFHGRQETASKALTSFHYISLSFFYKRKWIQFMIWSIILHLFRDCTKINFGGKGGVNL